MADSVTAFAPASIGNVAVGFDMLGLALDGVGDRVHARLVTTPGVSIANVYGMDGKLHPELSSEVDHNTASLAAKALWNDYGDDGGVELSIYKGVPLQSGMGSSAASAVAAAVAVNALLGTPLPVEKLLYYTLVGERYASGGMHADNVAPSLLGGLIFCPPVLLPEAVRLPVPRGVSAALIHPELKVNTAQARGGLASSYSMSQWLEQQAYLGGFIAACASSDIELLRRSLKDVIIEPQRASTVPCFNAVKEAAENGGALGFSLSGSGPSLFALCEDKDAENIAAAMERACHDYGIECQSYVSSMSAPGASIEE